MSETQPADGIYRDQTVRLTDFAALDDVIQGLTFERCQIVGPAVVILLGETRVTGCHWSGDAEAIIWPAHGRNEVVGAIGLKDCVLTNCELYRIGMLVPDEQMDAVRTGFGLS